MTSRQIHARRRPSSWCGHTAPQGRLCRPRSSCPKTSERISSPVSRFFASSRRETPARRPCAGPSTGAPCRLRCLNAKSCIGRNPVSSRFAPSDGFEFRLGGRRLARCGRDARERRRAGTAAGAVVVGHNSLGSAFSSDATASSKRLLAKSDEPGQEMAQVRSARIDAHGGVEISPRLLRAPIGDQRLAHPSYAQGSLGSSATAVQQRRSPRPTSAARPAGRPSS